MGRTVPVSEVYVVVTVAGELDDEGVRERLAEMLYFAAESFERPGFRGGTFGQDENGVDEIEIMVVDSIEAALRDADVDDAGPFGGEPGEA